MLNLFWKKSEGQEVILKIIGMHCTNCALTIDDALEETEGVLSSKTSYAGSKVIVEYDENKVTLQQLREIIKEQGYDTEV